ncbi:amidase [Acidithiobacillus marinus]|nr:amidase [Acidithiobacillus marinus]
MILSDLSEVDIVTLQSWMGSNICSSLDLVETYFARIAAHDSGSSNNGWGVNSVLEMNAGARTIAVARDMERKKGLIRGPLHGIPILVKDNIETGDGMITSAGSLALLDNRPDRDAVLIRRLRDAGAIILGKTNLSEWANFRSPWSTSGWSSRGGLTRNPYMLTRSASGSSSGSAAAVAANLCTVAVGTETDGSILSPAAACGLVGLKPGLGEISTVGVVPLAHSQDTAGPMARTVQDCALLYQVLRKDVACNRDPVIFSDTNRLKGTRVGVLRNQFELHRDAIPIFEKALDALQDYGVTLVEGIRLPDMAELGEAELEVLLYEFKYGINHYLKGLRSKDVPHSLEALIDSNSKNSGSVMPWFGQEYLELAAERGGLDEERYLDAKRLCKRLAWTEGLDYMLNKNHLAACVAPSNNPSGLIDLLTGDHHTGGSSTLAAVAGTPSLTVPTGHIQGLPIGATFFSGPGTESLLLCYGYALETVLAARIAPLFKMDMGE